MIVQLVLFELNSTQLDSLTYSLIIFLHKLMQAQCNQDASEANHRGVMKMYSRALKYEYLHDSTVNDSRRHFESKCNS